MALIIGGVALAIVVVSILVFMAKYHTVGPEAALIVTGSMLGNGPNVVTSEDGKKVKIIRGGGTFIVPVLQQAEPLSLLNYKLEVGTQDTITKQGVPVSAQGIAIIKVGSTIEEVSTAAEQYLGKNPEELKNEAKEVMEGHLRSILSSMTPEEANGNRTLFAQKVQEVASTDFSKMGLRVVSLTIKEIKDSKGYLSALGEPQIAAVKRDAAIANAEAAKQARIEQARAEKEAKEAELQRDTQIAEATKEKELKVADYRKQQDVAKAEADQAYHLQEAISKQRVKEEEMKVQIIEREKQIELEGKEIQRREKQYDAEVKKKADADRYAVEQSAEAEKARKIREADAKQYTIEAEAKARAEEVRVEGLAKAEIEKAQGLATAEAEKAKGSAEAEVTRLKGLAEAEAKQKIAEAFELFGQAAVMDMMVRMLPEYAKQVASPLANIDKITVVDTGGSGKNGGAGKVAGYATDLMATVQETLKASSGIDVKELLESFAGKGNVRNSIDNLASEIASSKTVAVETEAEVKDAE
ncbi:flotillin family protein [Bacillus thuringiensis]|uniref:flotillin family protein n=1 Tax=Bacillus thuringiensis TaxID=1428 RepID=UPI0021D6726E|nr:flotillin family protein [Bacillus thuringiensis]MCU7667559.1 flotillin family protein [Bacillus thuringiensis]